MRVDLYTKFLRRVFDDNLGVVVSDVKGKSSSTLLRKRKGKRKRLIRRERKNKCLEDDANNKENNNNVEIQEKEQEKEDVSGDDCCDDDDVSENVSKCNNRRHVMNLRNPVNRNDVREKTMMDVDDSCDDDSGPCDDDSGPDEELDSNKVFDFEGEEKGDELRDDLADESLCIRQQDNEWDDEAKCECRRRCIKLSNMVRIHVFYLLFSFNFVFISDISYFFSLSVIQIAKLRDIHMSNGDSKWRILALDYGFNVVHEFVYAKTACYDI